MKKRIILGLVLASTFALASCVLLSEDFGDTTVKTTDSTSTNKKEMKYEVGTATIDSWTDSVNSRWV